MKQELKMSQDEFFLKGIAEGNTAVIEQVYAKYFDSIVKYTLNNSGNIEDAKDLFQYAIMIMYEKLQDTDFKLRYGLHTYLYSICRNTWLKKLRKKTNKEGSLPANIVLIEEDAFEEEIVWREKERLYREKFSLLGETCQKIMRLFLDGVSMDKIADSLKLSSAAYAKKRKYKCKNKLFQLIKSDHQYRKLIEL